MNNELDKLISSFETKLNKKIGALETYNKDKMQLQKDITKLETEIAEPKNISDIVSKALTKFRDEYTTKYSNEVSNGLAYIIGGTAQSADCLMEFTPDNKQLQIEIKITYNNGKSIQGSPKDIESGGARDVMAVVFTLGYINQKAEIIGPVWMDEPTKQLSVGFSEPFYKYLEHAKNAIENQIILMTHDKSMIKDAKFAHNAIEIRLGQDGSSQVLTAQTS